MRGWSAHIELDTTEVTDEQIDQLHEALADHAPSVGAGPSGRLGVQLDVAAGSLRIAFDTAVRLVTDAARSAGVAAPSVSCEILDETESARRFAQPTIPDLIGFAGIAELRNVSRERARQFAQMPGFPPAVYDAKGGGPQFVRDRVVEFLKQHEPKAGPRFRTDGRRGTAGLAAYAFRDEDGVTRGPWDALPEGEFDTGFMLFEPANISPYARQRLEVRYGPWPREDEVNLYTMHLTVQGRRAPLVVRDTYQVHAELFGPHITNSAEWEQWHMRAIARSMS